MCRNYVYHIISICSILSHIVIIIVNSVTFRKLPIEIDITDVPKDPILPTTTELPSPMLSKMKKNTSGSHLFISQHRPTLPARTKQNSDSRLIYYQQHDHHGQHHKGIGCTRDMLPLQPVQETSLSAVTLDSESTPPPLPPKPIAT
jgi:hypothetical protein